MLAAVTTPDSMSADGIVWRPDPAAVAATRLTAFMRAHDCADYDDLLARSTRDPAWYWDAIIRFFDIRFTRPYQTVMDSTPGAPWTRWCVDGETNLTLNCLDRHIGTPTMDKPAIVWESETGKTRTWSYAELFAETCKLAEGLKGLGIRPGEAVGIFMPMLPETIAAFFAVARIGAIAVPLFSGFGADALASRLADARAVCVLTADATRRRGAAVPLKRTLDEAAARVPSLRHVVVLDSLDTTVPWHEGRDCRWHDVIAKMPAGNTARPMPADDPFMIVYTSGTTGKAKGTVHTHCGFVTKLASDFGLVLDVKNDDRILWMSDLGWLVGPMQIVVAAFFGATLVLAEGVPDYPVPGRLWRTVQDRRVSYLGIAPTVARAMMAHGDAEPARYDLSSLRAAVSSGELWNPDSWMWFFTNVCRRRAPIFNVSGGTEIGWGIVSCTPVHPLKPCAFAGPMPGMGADIVGPGGESLPAGIMGELALRIPSIGLSRGLWNAPERYLESYWTKIPGLWVHGDWASRDVDGFWFLHGRSDDTIMVAGKRCGPVEVESLVMTLESFTEVAATAIHDPLKGEAVLCVCVLKPDIRPTPELVERVRGLVSKNLSPAFRPKAVVFAAELPKTRSMKIMRRVVRALYEGRNPGDLASLVNPSAIAELNRAFAEHA